MSKWKIAGVQMDCRLMDRNHNLAVIRSRLREAAGRGSRLIIFPECVLTGYGFDSKEEALPHAETIPGPSSLALAADCKELGVWTIFGLLERGEGSGLFNACVLIGPTGIQPSYRKVHLPYIGFDKFATPGDRQFSVQDLGGLRIGMNICYDGSFPEPSRVLALLGADLVVLPTNWPMKSASTPKHIVPTRAIENHIYYAAINRVGEERGFRYLGQSRIVDFEGEVLAAGGTDTEEILYAEIDPEKARQKRVINIPGVYELDRIGHRRPEMYNRLVEK